MQIQIDKTSGVPIHDQIKEQITGLIHAGRLNAGDQLPTIRALAIDLAVNVNTVALAYRELDSAGVIATRRGEGTFVASTPGAAEMKRLRQKKLRDVVQSMLDETRRLGYSLDEVQQALAGLIAKRA
jgi:GntR family transcriptional regulator